MADRINRLDRSRVPRHKPGPENKSVGYKVRLDAQMCVCACVCDIRNRLI